MDWGGGGGGLNASGVGKGGPQLHPREDSMLCRRGSAVWLCPPHAGMGGGGEEGGQVNQASPTPRGDSMWVGGEGEDRGRAWLAHPTRRQHEGGWEGGGGGEEPVRWKGSS